MPSFDEFLFLRFRAANVEPYPFERLNYEQPEYHQHANTLNEQKLSA